jgi:HNH endonuclease
MDQAARKPVWQRAGGICEYCCMPQTYDPLPFQIDHILARKHGGTDAADNLALACLHCNNHKGPNIAGFDGPTGATVSLYDPRRNIWSEHFRWEGPQIIGTSAVGRVTVDVLAMNIQYRLDHRAALLDEGVFPAPAS